jgi:photosystem II stability/assembly factor-like uncharacterized protein
MKNFRILLVVSTALLAANFALAQTWTQTSAPSNGWASVASSADGSQLVAAAYPGPIYISTNSGSAWTLTSAPNEYWLSVASSADGTKLVAVSDGPIYVSTNSGTSWTLTSAPNEYWGSVASSADGNKLVAVAPLGMGGNGPAVIYTSTNSGTTWIQQTNTDIAFPFWISVASSADGTRLVVVGGHRIYYSTNSGTTWAQTGTHLGPSSLLSPSRVIASSADGNKWVAGFTRTDNGPSPIYTSTNSGDSWTLTSAPSNSWLSVAMSADGSKIVAVGSSFGDPGPIYTSTDFGVTWTSNNVPQESWWAVASSADGGKLVAASGFNDINLLGSIYTSQTTPTPQLNLAPSGSNLNVSWIIPSTNFVLQQNLDLTTTNWTDVTNTPALNLTTLQDEVILSPTNGSGFYRLKTP